MTGGIPVSMGQAQARFPQVSQPQVSSPIIRQNTPQTASSPMGMAGVAMQHSNSNLGQAGSPPRPPSVVQNHPMGVPMAPACRRAEVNRATRGPRRGCTRRLQIWRTQLPFLGLRLCRRRG
jgi:transcription factor SPT20